jgi:hypothetical protein
MFHGTYDTGEQARLDFDIFFIKELGQFCRSISVIQKTIVKEYRIVRSQKHVGIFDTNQAFAQFDVCKTHLLGLEEM